ncbi:hypothetical protein WPS_01820 [Vulcanimicrobium alpinum]|uniref:Uncharacterized protein n=1 Tax=Vulcanimicrobium alpinum TaxID=3016050 RepID=A0AAN1XS85_UNVUL|nr:hypothetical protein [Vulcanimicrobium alpinum]BDE04906.1 hypothetical protein WPS_01820 [Vulcanimicrobium alpinum]
METILGLIFSYLVFVTRTWPATRLAVLTDIALALLYDFTPLRLHFGPLLTIALSATLLLWIVNLVVDRREPAKSR